LAVAIGAVYLVQLYRQASDSGLDFMDIVGAAPVVAIVGGVLMLLNR
jgi:hypothetical protein